MAPTGSTNDGTGRKQEKEASILDGSLGEKSFRVKVVFQYYDLAYVFPFSVNVFVSDIVHKY